MSNPPESDLPPTSPFQSDNPESDHEGPAGDTQPAEDAEWLRADEAERLSTSFGQAGIPDRSEHSWGTTEWNSIGEGNEGSARELPPREVSFPLRGPDPNRTLSWLVILLSFAGILILMRIQPSSPKSNSAEMASTPEVAAALRSLKDPNQDFALLMLELGARGAPFDQNFGSRAVEHQLSMYELDLDTPEVQMRLAAVDLFQSTEAAWKLAHIIERIEYAEQLHRRRMGTIPHDEWPSWALAYEKVHKTVDDICSSDRSPSASEAALLTENLQSFGKMIVAHYEGANSPARAELKAKAVQMVIAIVLAFLGLAIGLISGIILFCIVLLRLTKGRLKFRLNPRQLFSTQSSNLFLEAFAIYFASIIVSALFIRALGVSEGLASILPIVAGSVIGVAWPFLRGLPIRRAAFELGFSRGRGVFREIGAGVIGYLSMVPLYLVGILISFFFMMIYAMFSGQQGGPAATPEMSHPIIQPLLRGELWLKLVIFGFAAGFAPFFEETMFRGAFYGALRRRLPIPVAAVIMAFIFAAIHPQGFMVVPALMSLAISFALLREWRGSLIAPMTAHALHNGFLVGIFILII